MVYINSIYTGLLVFPFIAALITLPYAVYQYRLADVEDLICNTLGAGGYFMASVFEGVIRVLKPDFYRIFHLWRNVWINGSPS